MQEQRTPSGLVIPRMCSDFDPEQASYYHNRRGWPVTFLPVSSVNLVAATPGSALECSDGRSDNSPGKEMFGPRVFGQVNAVAAMLEGGDMLAIARASQRIIDAGYRPGTHSAENIAETKGSCGWFERWAQDEFEHVKYPYTVPTDDIIKHGFGLGDFIKLQMKMYGGKHFKLLGHHEEKALRLNPFEDTTESDTTGDRFRGDDWLLARVGVPFIRRMHHYSETVTKLKPNAAKLEIIVPDAHVDVLQRAA